MKIRTLLEAPKTVFDRWASEKAAQNRANAKLAKDVEKNRRELEKASERIEKKQALAKKKKLDAAVIWQKVQDVVSNTFPDGDPSDHLRGFMQRNNLTMDDIDRVVNKYEKRKNGFYGYLADMWDDTAADQIHDAKSGHMHDVDRNSPFYTVDEDGKVEPQPNPWK